MQCNLTTTGTVATVTIDDLHLSLVHPVTIDILNNALEKFTWAEILESNDLQTAILSGEIVCTDDSANVMNSITLDHINESLGAAGANLTATVAPTTVTINSDSGTDAVIAAADGTNAGLMLPADKTKMDFIAVTQAVDLDTMEQDILDHQTALGIADGDQDFGTFTGVTITDNSTAKVALQELETAIEAITADGNETPIVRGDAVTGVAPTVGEVATPEAGDTASVFLTDGQLEKWVHNGTSWSLAYTLAANIAADLAYTASPTNGIVTSSTGTDATIPLGTGTNAGLLAPADKTKVDLITITQAVDLDELEAESANLVTLSGVASDATDLGTFTGATVTDNVTTKVAIQELETAIEASTADLAYTASPTNGIVTNDVGTDATITLATTVNAGLQAPADKTKQDFISITQAVDLDDVEANQNDLITLSGVAENATDLGTFTGDIITDNVVTKVAIQELETEIEARVYGTNFNLFSDTGISTTTLTAFQDKINDTTTALEAGDYKITVSYTWNHNAVNNDFEARFLFNGAAAGQDAAGLIHKAEPKDAGGNAVTGSGSSQRYDYTKTYYVTGVTAGTKTVQLSYRTDNAGTASTILEAYIEIIRVA